MPVAIVVVSDTVPQILTEETEAALLTRLKALPAVPTLYTAQEARKWLASLPHPSGWFYSIVEARAHAKRAGAELR